MTYDPTDPDDVLAEARTLANVGRLGEALACYEWYFANAVRIDRAHRGVRRSFVLSDWAKLGEVYPAARVSLIQQFTAAAECAKETGEIEAFLDADATSDYLGMQEAFIDLLRDMMSRWPEIARKVYPEVILRVIEQDRHREFRALLGDPAPILRSEAFVLEDVLARKNSNPEFDRHGYAIARFNRNCALLQAGYRDCGDMATADSIEVARKRVIERLTG